MRIEDIFSDLPTLETGRTILRKLRSEDEPDIFRYGSDDEVSRYTSWPTHQTMADTRHYLNKVLQKYDHHAVAPWGIVDKETGRVIGTSGFMAWNVHHAKAELGYALSKDYWNRGYMTEVIRTIISYGFEVMKLVRIEASCLPSNLGSARVMEKAGMTFEGIIRQSIFVKGKHEDLKLYSIVVDDYRNQNKTR
ncbi:GNAT family N-acetyltransferase [Paenibacillus sp. Y412MC10]|uniref:GNAT family N-acetyltransferase n=1 Tax=Geobacillus sp. (strain Y412MC10) TaxID=481743 RepID=UPI0001788493|nr:GNAT family N-acetyltransferase [Paenibacillus sp. Y412MC10]ACX66712.1 GCN5-related N-acetyltransferase [Paenibacillus sp. Y412MC10]